TANKPRRLLRGTRRRQATLDRRVGAVFRPHAVDVVERARRHDVRAGHELLDPADHRGPDGIPSMVSDEQPQRLSGREYDVAALRRDRTGSEQPAEIAAVADQIHHDADSETGLVPTRA